ncbi:MAG TPA: alpha-amylase family glycosyl hydrolase, partial [Candidatus Saccharimonadales bacterium]|nr:alpha-amylase family glycosyl hydrolase [Candidatus Saccharimonadales bacterium]
DGHYLFVWIRIAPKAAPGKAQLKVSTAAGSMTVSLPLAQREKIAETGKGVHQDDVLYLIMPDRFADGDSANNDPPQAHGHYDRSDPKAYHGGDLKGIQQHLAYLKELGVTTLWLTPWWKNDSNAADYHGYHVTDFYGVEDHFGTLADLREFVTAAHASGIKVVSDYVANHTGPDHPWTKRPPTSTWLHGTNARHMEPKYDFWPLVDIHSDLRDRRPVVEGWFADKLPDLNPDDPLLAEYLADNAIWWMESAHFDAYRLDTFPYSSRQFWGRWHATLRQCYPRLTTVGEVFNEDSVITSYFEGGRVLQGVDSGTTSVFDFPLYGALRAVLLRGEPVTKLVNVLQHDYLYQRSYGLYTFFGNHDIRRFMSEPTATVPKLNAAFSLLFTLRGIPGIYYGDELAMDGRDDPDNRHDFPGGFAGDAQNAFAAATRTPEQQQVFSHVRQLARLRREHPALQQGELTTIASSENYFAFVRAQGNDRLLVVFNASSSEQTIELPRADTPLETVKSISAELDAKAPSLAPDKLALQLAPTSVAIYRVQ